MSDLPRVALVSGAARGIGMAVAETFAAEGCRVVLGDVDLAEAERVAARLSPDGRAALAVSLDVTRTESVDAAVAAAAETFGTLDVLVNVAGTINPQPSQEVTDQDWDDLIGVHLDGTFRCCRAAGRAMERQESGSIVNVSSINGQNPAALAAAYNVAKAGVISLTRTLALELGKFGITANYLEPGAIKTGMTSGLWDARPDVAEIWAKKAALRRLGQPIDLARAALFLASDDGGFVTGHGLVVDGGLMLRV